MKKLFQRRDGFEKLFSCPKLIFNCSKSIVQERHKTLNLLCSKVISIESEVTFIFYVLSVRFHDIISLTFLLKKGGYK